jgi:hypothetical protein
MFLADDPYRMVLPLGHRLALDRLCADAGFEPDVAYVVQDVTVGRAFGGCRRSRP